MANPTTNFGWVMPTSSSLVTNLPADFNTFGQAVDTSMAELKGGTTGQILSKTSATDMDFTWITNDVGDITAVTAGTGISGGGTSGAVTITNSMATEITAKGDLIAGTGSATFDNLPVGTNGQTLVADSTASTGLKWATPASGLSAATQAEMESASSTAVAVTPGRQQYHPSAAKGWANFNGTTPYAINASYNVSSVSSVGTAQYRVNWDVDFSSANYAYTMNCEKLATDAPTTATMIVCNPFTVAAGYIDFALMCVNGTRTESGKVVITAFGDQ